MPLISLDDDDQRWVPTHVNVTVLRARALRTKGKQGSRYVYTVIQVGKEKYTTGLVEKAEEPQWDEECSLELPPGLLVESGGVGAYPPGSGKLLLTVMHRVLIGLDVFLGQAVVSLDKVFQEGACPRNEWLKLHSKAGRKEKERGALQVTVQFTRNNMTASMYDLTVKDKPRSAFGKLKDRVTGKKRTDVESSSAILPGRYAALSGSVGPPFAGDGGADEPGEDQWVEEPKSKVKDFFLKGKMRKNSDTRSCSSLASDSSVASSAGDPFIPIELSRTPVYSSRVMEPFHMENDGGVQVMTHKRAHSDDASKIAVVPLSSSAVENLKGPNIPLSKSTVCINGSHVYSSEPGISKSPGPAPAKRSLLEKCAPLSRSLQNLTRRGEDPLKSSSEKKNGEAEVTQVEARCVKPAGASGVSEVMDKGKRLRRTLFSSGRSDSLPAKPEQSQVSASLEGRRRGWFGSGDSQNKPRPGLFPKVACSSDTPLPSNQPPCSLPLHTPDSQSPPSDNPTNPFTHISPSPPSISPSNPFLTRLQQNPFFEDLLAEEALRSPTAAHCFRSIHRLPVGADHPIPQCNGVQTQMFLMKRERPKSISRQRSLPTITNESPEKHSRSKHSSSERSAESDDFEAFASSRLKTPSGTPTRPSLASQAQAANLNSCGDDQSVITEDLESSSKLLDLPPLPPRRPLRGQTSKERCLDSWLDRAQELAVLKEASFLSQSDFASLKHVRQEEANRNSQIEANFLCSKEERDPDSTGNVSEATVVNKNLGEDARGSSPRSEGECSAPETLCFPSDWETTVTESLCSSPQTKSKEDPQCETAFTLKHADVVLLDLPRRDSNNNTDSSEIAFIDSGSSASELVETNRACVEDSREGPEGVRNTSEIQMFSPNTDMAIVETSPVQNPVTCSSAFERSCDRQEHHHTSPESDVLLNKALTVMTTSGCLSRVDSSVLQMTHNAKQKANACQEPKHSTIQKTLNESFEDLHASVAPRSPAVRSARTRPRSTTSSPKTLSDAEPNRPSSEPILQNFSASCLAATSNCLLPGLSSTLIPPIETPGVGSSTVPPHVDAALKLSPETSRPLHEESSPHPVKPLTVQGEKRAESRSVLEKLKSTINPSRSPPATAADDEQNQMSLMEARAQYQNLSNMELIALLLQQEMDVKKQRAESEVQLALLEKREVELKKMKVQVRDLEDYIDKLLVRIMEQTPTLLQVRGRPK